MAKALKAVGKVAGIVATVAAFIPGGQPIAAAAAAVAAVSNVGAAILQKPPAARGSVNSISIGANQPTPYLIGRSYTGGTLVYDRAYGPTINDVPNPYRLMVRVLSLGPIESIEATLADFTPVTFGGSAAAGWFSGFLYRSTQNGATPEGAALAPNWSGAPSWDAAAKISGKAAVALSLKFDKKGERFAGGVPQFGEVGRGVLVYDARQDSDYPGGSGACRPLNEATYVGGAAAENPGCHALTYALGRYQNGRKVFGIGLPAVGIVLSDFVEFANICDANGWKVGGTIFEPGDRWENLKNICVAGGAEPVFKGGRLGLRINTPRVSLGTIGTADLAEGEIVVPGCQTWRDRLNTILPEFRSESHKWEYVQSSKVTVASFRDEDGEEKVDTRRLNLVQQSDQAAQLAAYELYDRRERGPIDLPCTYRMRNYPVGAKLTLAAPVAAELGLEASPDVIVLKRTVDPGTMTVVLTVRTENSLKHAAALAVTGSSPAVPLIVAPELVDQVAAGNAPVPARGSYRFLSSDPAYRLNSDDESVSVVAFTGVLDDGRELAFPAFSFAALASTAYRVFWDLQLSTYQLVSGSSTSLLQSDRYVWIGDIRTLNAAGEAPPTTTPPPGGGGYGPGNPIP